MDSSPPDNLAPSLGRSIPRVEDAALLTGRARFFDDLATPPGTLHAAILRSPHAHAAITGIDTARAAALPGVAAILTGADITRLTTSLVVGVRAPIECWPIATDRVRYMGEPVAVAVASRPLCGRGRAGPDRCPLRSAARRHRPARRAAAGRAGAASRPERATSPATAASATATPKPPSPPHRTASASPSPIPATPARRSRPMACWRNTTPLADAYDVLANFQGPFSLHAVIARALRVPGNRLRLRTPPEFRRQLRREAGGVPLHRADGRRRPRGGPAGEMGGGPAGAPRRLGLRHQPRYHAERGGAGGRADHRARLGPGRGCRRPSARARAGHALPHARQHDRRLRHPPPGDPQPRRADQQAADRAEPRLRRAAGVFRAGTADAAHRGRTRAWTRWT